MKKRILSWLVMLSVLAALGAPPLAVMAEDEEGIIIKTSLEYSQDFENADKIDEGFVKNLDASKFYVTTDADNNHVYCLDGSGVIIGTGLFGPSLSDYIMEVDAQELSATGSNGAAFSLGMRAVSNKRYHFGYYDIVRYDESKGTITSDAPTTRDRMGIAYWTGSYDLGKWTYNTMSPKNLGILNTSKRNFGSFYRFKCATVGDIGAMSASGAAGTFSIRSNDLSRSGVSDKGQGFLSAHGIKVWFDNIRFYKAIYAKRLELHLGATSVMPGEKTTFEIRAYKNDTEYVVVPPEYVQLDYDNTAISLNAQTGELETDPNMVGDYAITVAGVDAIDGRTAQATATLSVSYDARDVMDDYTALTLPVSGEASQDFALPLQGAHGTEIRWQSSNESVIAINGATAVVTRPSPEQEDANVTLTATIVKNQATAVKEFKFLVRRLLTDREIVDNDCNAIVIDTQNPITEDLNLPSQGPYGSSYRWSSGNTAYISGSGHVNRPARDDVTVALTVTVSYGSVSKELRYNVTVKGYGRSSGGGGGGGGGHSVTSSVTVDLPAATSAPTPAPTVTPVPAAGYNDLDETQWARKYIEWCSAQGIVTGSGSFRPNDGVTREELVKMVVNAMGVSGGDATVDFADVPAGTWYYHYVARAVSSGIITGISSEEFGTGRVVTRQDAAVILYRALKASGSEMKGAASRDFTDGQAIAPYAREAVSALVGAGIISGMEDGSFAPQRQLTRAQAAKLLYMLKGGAPA